MRFSITLAALLLAACGGGGGTGDAGAPDGVAVDSSPGSVPIDGDAPASAPNDGPGDPPTGDGAVDSPGSIDGSMTGGANGDPDADPGNDANEDGDGDPGGDADGTPDGDGDDPGGDDPGGDADGAPDGDGDAPDGDDPGGDADGDPDGDGGDPGGDDPDGDGGGDVTGEDGGSGSGLIGESNYVGLTEFAVQMNIVILTDRARSPAVFLERFPGSGEDSLASANETATGGGDCPLGGSYDQLDMGDRDSVSFARMLTYTGCATDAGTLSGSHDLVDDTGGGIISDDYDLALEQQDGPDGSGTTVLRASYETGRMSSVDFSVEDYSRDTERNPFAVSGSGSRRLDTAFDDGTIFFYDTETSIRVVSDAGPIELRVTTNDLAFNRTTPPVRGTISLVAQDGSRVDVGVSDTPGVMTLNRTDASARTFTDTIAWEDIYKPPE